MEEEEKEVKRRMIACERERVMGTRRRTERNLRRQQGTTGRGSEASERF